MWTIGILLGISVGFHMGWYGKRVYEMIRTLLDREPEQDSKVITPLPAGYVDVNNMTSGIITPKTPAQIEYEERKRMEQYQ